MNDFAKLIRSNQEQAAASWVNYLNQVRIDQLLTSFKQQDTNLLAALTSVNEAVRTIGLEVVTTNRGGQHGMHGFIAELAEVGIGNARKQIFGQEPVYQWVNDNGPVDLIRSGTDIQQKFVAAGGRFSLGAIAEHLQRYPDYVKNGGKYQIPRDHFEVIQRLHSMSPEEAGKVLSRSSGGPSFTDWERLNRFLQRGSIGLEALEPSTLEYRQVQKDIYESTMAAEKNRLRTTDQSLRDKAYRESRPSLHQGASATVTAAAFEGGTAFVMAVVTKTRQGKRVRDFSREDWLGVAGETGLSLGKGGIRGSSGYALTNFTATPAAVASSMVSAAFGIAEQANKLRRGEIGESEFVENSELLSMAAAVSALSSYVGQALIPVPVLGAVIGNTVGTLMYRTAASALSKRETELIERYLDEQRTLDEQLTAEQQELVQKLNGGMSDYLGLLERAFSPDLQIALLGSAELARELGVPTDDILDSEEKIRAYFLD